MAAFYSRLLALLCFTSCCLLLFFFQNNSLQKPHTDAIPFKAIFTCKTCKKNSIISQLLKTYSPRWRRDETNFTKFRSLLNNKCNASSKAVVTQANTPLGSKLVYDGEPKRSLEIKQDLFSRFVKESPFGDATQKSCSVVGNGGILLNSSCGQKIDFAHFVIRCNIPPMGSEHERDVGSKTHLVTANPSIFSQKYKSLEERRRPMVESLHAYGNSLLLLPAFSFSFNTPLCLRVHYTLEDFSTAGPQAVFLNPDYVRCLSSFWKDLGLRAHRLSSGLMMVSLAMELCDTVHLYGFWPFEHHPVNHQQLTNHYYDDRKVSRVHSMSTEFELLLRFHTNGIVNLHLGECPV
ncbi:alpha-2,8-sialyltransferase 8F-like isoform X1 [Trichomycterus rosablanca]|uniref:alpha-2,8-sialyltransferase 8F-like isoform X1 n=1 Tax=Trichomycterus rosablanca TaxID=2290929 RepID=UPI002F360B63